jgi:hypothetical protein
MTRHLVAAAVIAAAALPAPASAMPTRDHGASAPPPTAAQMLTQAHVQRALLEHDPVGRVAAPASRRHSFPWIETAVAVALAGALVSLRVRSPGRPAAARR